MASDPAALTNPLAPSSRILCGRRRSPARAKALCRRGDGMRPRVGWVGAMWRWGWDLRKQKLVRSSTRAHDGEALLKGRDISVADSSSLLTPATCHCATPRCSLIRRWKALKQGFPTPYKIPPASHAMGSSWHARVSWHLQNLLLDLLPSICRESIVPEEV